MRGAMMRGSLAIIILTSLLFLFSTTCVVIAENITEHSFVLINGYMEDSVVYQTSPGFDGLKLVAGTQGSGFVSRRQTMYETSDSMAFNEWGYFDYHPYELTSTESNLTNKLCYKNYEVGTVLSERYSSIDYLVKDTTVYEDSNVSVYQIGSIGRGVSQIGAKVQPTATSVPMMILGGTYVGEFNIRQEIGVDTNGAFYLTCP